MSIEQMVERLAARGLLSCTHILNIWQTADGKQWGASIEATFQRDDTEVYGNSLREVLEELMRRTNRGADL